MNKLVSVKQSKKNVELFDDEEDYLDDEDISDTIYDDSLGFSSKLRTVVAVDNTCQNEKCQSTVNEIRKLTEECNNLDKKCILMDFAKSEELFEISERLSGLCKAVDSMLGVIEIYEGESLDNLSYEKLAKIEISLMKLLLKVRAKLSKIEYDIIRGVVKKPEEESTKCWGCKKTESNMLLKPCNHLAMCMNCVGNTLKCPVCLRYIEYYEKVFLPNS